MDKDEQIKALRKALEQIRKQTTSGTVSDSGVVMRVQRIARQALAAGEAQHVER